MNRTLSDCKIGEIDQYLFGKGTHCELYRKLGAHPVYREKHADGVFFAVWAPHAKRVSAVGEFNDWNPESDPLTCDGKVGIWSGHVKCAAEGQLYKFCVETQEGELLYKADPFANQAELRPGTASRIAETDRIKWTDDEWMKKRQQANFMKEPISIYECHIGSWKRHPGRNDDGFYTYREFAHSMVEYLEEMPYTHIELIGILEHPFDGSWGYQVTGYFAPTSRYGTLEDFAYMIDYFHTHGYGVILDWVPAHFPKDAHGLAFFDGTPTYESADPLKMEQPDWNTHIFDFGKPEVDGFLTASALFWIEMFHVDGLRVDAVASILYLDFGKRDGEWRPNSHGGNVNEEAVAFLKHMNKTVLTRNPGALMIAEESTTWPNVTWPPEDGGLGFNLKWNMGWMHDFLEYMKLDPYFRKNAHNMMTFASSYAYSENFILVLSHDEVVHMKGSMYGKMPGDESAKFANLKCGYAFMFGHPGKKLLFMGQDFGQIREWDEKRELDWGLLADPGHSGVNRFVGALLDIYRSHPALSEQDASMYGMEWVNADDAYRSIYSFIRHSENAEKNLLFVINFTPVAYDDYRVGMPVNATCRLLVDASEARFGGSRPDVTAGDGADWRSDAQARASVGGDSGAGDGRGIDGGSFVAGDDSADARGVRNIYPTEKAECDSKPYSFAYPLAPYAAAVFEYDKPEDPAEAIDAENDSVDTSDSEK